jgi:hypothetical protein
MHTFVVHVYIIIIMYTKLRLEVNLVSCMHVHYACGHLSREEADVVGISLEQGIELIEEYLNALLPVGKKIHKISH